MRFSNHANEPVSDPGTFGTSESIECYGVKKYVRTTNELHELIPSTNIVTTNQEDRPNVAECGVILTMLPYVVSKKLNHFFLEQ